jgi:hypothetical protein
LLEQNGIHFASFRFKANIFYAKLAHPTRKMHTKKKTNACFTDVRISSFSLPTNTITYFSFLSLSLSLGVTDEGFAQKNKKLSYLLKSKFSKAF